ncbi:MAG: NAD(P)H-dependent oxidoreductase [Gammaproteobacteria bacterium]|nr:NAD(P)H-dependent oxidoreductase [Gammaproteobacteria bacterium]
MKRKVLVVLGHSCVDSLCAALATAYRQAAEQAGHEVRWLAVGQLQFDPLLHHGYGQPQELEPDLLAAQQAILWADHLLLVYPTWWGGMPALLKGFIDRVFLPGFAFKYRTGSSLWDKLLSGRSAQLLVTMDSPPWYYRFINHMPGHHQMKRTILEFCGIRPVQIHSFGPVRGSTPEQRQRWLSKVSKLAAALR